MESKIGRPTKYKPEYCEQLREFFSGEPCREVIETISGKNWSKEESKLLPNRFPTFENFAASVNVHVDTLHEWCEVYPEFSEAYTYAKNRQKAWLIENGMNGTYNPHFTQFVAKNITDMKDKTEVDLNQSVSVAGSLSEARKRAANATIANDTDASDLI